MERPSMYNEMVLWFLSPHQSQRHFSLSKANYKLQPSKAGHLNILACTHSLHFLKPVCDYPVQRPSCYPNGKVWRRLCSIIRFRIPNDYRLNPSKQYADLFSGTFNPPGRSLQFGRRNGL